MTSTHNSDDNKIATNHCTNLFWVVQSHQKANFFRFFFFFFNGVLICCVLKGVGYVCFL